MSNATRFFAALSLAGAMLVHSPASFAQERLRQAYVPPAYADCYYNVGGVCDTNGAYAAIGPAPYGGPFAAIGVVPQRSYLATTLGFWRGLRGGDWTAIHGANQ